MAQRSIEETFRQIKPRGQRAIPDAPVLEAGVGDTGDLSTALSQAGQQIQQMQAAWQQQAAAIAANTQAIQSNTSSHGSQSAGSIASSAASSVENGLGLLGPLISGIASLFGDGSSTPAPLPVYVPPAPVAIDASLRSNVAPAQSGSPTSAPAGGSSAAAAAPTINVNVTAMDSQSFMDRSADIASAVREAMLNLHPINDVVANL
jgi:hypothetical protein